jgi:hypothetical protein
MAKKHDIPWLPIPRYVIQPRESAAYQIVAILALLSNLKLTKSVSAGSASFCLNENLLETTVTSLEELVSRLHWAVPFQENTAKQMASQLFLGDNQGKADGSAIHQSRIPIIMSSISGAAVTYELYTQLCEASKILCHYAALPEALHNLVECMKFNLVSGSGFPWTLYFMESEDDEPRVHQRWRYTIQEIFPDIRPCSFRANGKTPFERSMLTYFFNAWLRLYIAFLNGAEPLPVPTMTYMKDYMHTVART